MRKAALLFFLACVAVVAVTTAGCSGKKPEAEAVAADSTEARPAEEDTLDLEEDELLADEPMPKAADELFDDFIFNFASKRAMQLSRTVFPLPVTNGKMSSIKRSQWQTERFFMPQGFYTLIFDSRRDMDAPNDTSVSKAVIEKIFLRDNWVRQYEFSRTDGQWVLRHINNMPMSQNHNASFLEFYERFAADSAFQVESMHTTVQVTAPDPDDDFDTQTGEIMPEQWEAFKPAFIPQGMIYNIIYGQPAESDDNEKIFVIRGIANGLETEMTFRRIGGAWKLVKLNT